RSSADERVAAGCTAVHRPTTAAAPPASHAVQAAAPSPVKPNAQGEANTSTANAVVVHADGPAAPSSAYSPASAHSAPSTIRGARPACPAHSPGAWATARPATNATASCHANLPIGRLPEILFVVFHPF